MKPVLPLITVCNDGELERGAVEEDELYIGEGVHLLSSVAHLNVLRDGLVKVSHSRILGSPTTKEGILLYCPNDLESTVHDTHSQLYRQHQ